MHLREVKFALPAKVLSPVKLGPVLSSEVVARHLDTNLGGKNEGASIEQKKIYVYIFR